MKAYKQTSLRFRGREKGFTLAELTIVLVIGTLIAATAIFGLPKLLANYRANKIITEMNTAIPAIQAAYQNQTSFANLTTAQVARNGWLSNNYIETDASGVPTGNLMTSWGAITFVPASSNTQGQGTINSVPKRECMKIAEMFDSDTFLTATINGTSVKNIATSRAVDLTAVGTQCNTTTTNTIVFNFSRA